MPVYSSRYVHKVAPSAADTGRDVTCAEWTRAYPEAVGASARILDRRHVGAVLRAHGLIGKGESIHSARIETDGRVVAFPNASIWHSIILTPKA